MKNQAMFFLRLGIWHLMHQNTFVKRTISWQFRVGWLNCHDPGVPSIERSLRSTVRHDAISGGRIGICHGNGEAEIGPLGRTSSGENRVWDMEELRNTREATNDWSSARLSSLLPAAFHVCFASQRERDGRWISSCYQSPRSIWRARVLPRTSLSRCVACLAQEIATRNETRATATHYEECLQEEETERWRRMRPSTRTLMFRQYSCVFGMTRSVSMAWFA